jgi:hypothetical protein
MYHQKSAGDISNSFYQPGWPATAIISFTVINFSCADAAPFEK